MMSRILGRHEAIFTFNELHFFEQLWTPVAQPEVLTPAQARHIAARLMTIQREGYYAAGDSRPYKNEADALIRRLPEQIVPSDVFEAFLEYETTQHGKAIACDQTPRNIYYLREILDLFPDARIINMIRDPRDVLLSQKNRWKRRFLDGRTTPFKHTVRTWIDYHPVTIGILWNSGIVAADQFEQHPRVFHLRFEDLLEKPATYVSKLCAFLDLDFSATMLDVPQIGSSNVPDQPEQRGINPSVRGRWRDGGLETTEVYIIQKITHRNMLLHDYEPETIRPNVLALAYHALSWPLKTGLALFFNANRTRNLIESIRRRLAT